MRETAAIAEPSAATDVLSVAARVAGEAAARRLVEHLGGSRVYVPANPRPGSGLLVKAVGLEAARALAREWGNTTILVPLGVGFDQASRRRRIANMLAAGKSVQAIARDLKVHERTVERLKARLDVDDPNAPKLL